MRPIIQNNQFSSYGTTLAVSEVIKKTYLLLSLTLFFSASMAYFAIATQAQPVGFLMLLIGMFGLYFLTTALRNSPWGILAIFLYTGFMGYTLGPVLNFYIHNFTNGSELIVTALGATGFVFLALSTYVIVSKKDFSYMTGLLSAAAMIAFMAGIAAILFKLPLLSLGVSAIFALISSGFILHTTSEIIYGGEKNYIMATISLYIAIFNLFVSLLRLLSFFAGGSNRE